MTAEEKHKLLGDIIKYLRIDEPIDSSESEMLMVLIDDGIIFLNHYTGTQNNYSSGNARRLLKDFVRYAYNNASEYYESNFSEELGRLQWEEAVRDYQIKKTNNAEPKPPTQ